MSNKLEIAANAVTVIAGVLLIAVATPRLRGEWRNRAASGSQIVSMKNTETRLPVPFIKGDRGASVAVIEFSDFQCPYCGQYARETLKQFERDFVASGKVVFGFRNFPLSGIHQFASGAALAAICAGESDQFWKMHDGLFEEQRSLDTPSLLASAKSLGFLSPTFSSCVSGEHSAATARLDDDIREAKRLGIKSTPTFLIGPIKNDTVIVNSMIVGNKPVAIFAQAIAESAKQRSRVAESRAPVGNATERRAH
jgi:protein-disulfide isomerase